MNTSDRNQQAAKLSDILLSWYDSERRILPWREDPTPYHVWVSEIMLQQTRVDTVIEYYQRFLRELPDVKALAEAEEERLLKLWQGLGYYSRIRNMHKGAVQVMEEYGGEIPGTPKELQKLSGIGESVAAAISSIAFAYPIPSVDGNLLRVYARMTGYEESIRTTAARKVATAYYEEILDRTRPGDMNQALMDLGATICLPNGAPLCEKCPWQMHCAAHRTGKEQQLPVKEEKKQRRKEKRTVLRIRLGDRVVIGKRPERGLLANLYELPNAEGWLTEPQAEEACRTLGYEPKAIRKLKPSKHIFSHVEWHMHAFEIEAEERPDASAAENGFFAAEKSALQEEYSIPTAFKAYMDF